MRIFCPETMVGTDICGIKNDNSVPVENGKVWYNPGEYLRLFTRGTHRSHGYYNGFSDGPDEGSTALFREESPLYVLLRGLL